MLQSCITTKLHWVINIVTNTHGDQKQCLAGCCGNEVNVVISLGKL